MGLLPDNKLFAKKTLLGIAITVAALFLVFRKVDIGALVQVFANMHFGWFAAAVLGYGAALMCAAWRWHLMLRLTGCPVHLLAATRVYYIGACLGFIFFGPAVGDVAKSALYARWHRAPLPQVIASAPLDRILGIGGLVIFCIPALALAAVKGAFEKMAGPGGFKVPVPLLIVGALAGIAGLAVIFKWRPKSESAVAKTFKSFAESFTKLIASPRLAASGLALGLTVQMLSCVIYALCLKAVVHHPCPWMEMLWTFPVIGAMTSLPSVGGLGVREVAAATLLSLYNVSQTDAVASSLLQMGVTMVWAAVGGFLLMREEKLFDRVIAGGLRDEPRTISAVIPTLNEAGEIAETIRRARRVSGITEIIVVDGDSQDATPTVAEANGARVITSPPGRGTQLRAGAAVATGEVILLLHADTWLPPEAGQAMAHCLRDQTAVGGGFWKVFRPPVPPLMRGSRFKCFIRLVTTRRIMGDQAIFVRREALEKVGSVPDRPLMEEFELCRRLRQLGRLAIADAVVTTSCRRFTKLGVLRTYARMWLLTLRYYAGTPPEKLQQLYERS